MRRVLQQQKRFFTVARSALLEQQQQQVKVDVVEQQYPPNTEHAIANAPFKPTGFFSLDFFFCNCIFYALV